MASALGSHGVDLVGIEILESGGGSVIDELTLWAEDRAIIDLGVQALVALDGVAVEEVRPASSDQIDPELAVLSEAVTLATAAQSSTDADGRAAAIGDAVVASTSRLIEAEWAALVDLDQGTVVGIGSLPTTEWVVAFARGAVRTHPSGTRPVEISHAPDVMAAEVPATPLIVVVGRAGRTLLDRERRRVTALAHMAGALLAPRP